MACSLLTAVDDAFRFGTMKEADGGQKWYWEVPSWDNAWWDGALLMASQGVTGPKNEFVDFPRSFVEKWTKGQSPLRCVSRQLSSTWQVPYK